MTTDYTSTIPSTIIPTLTEQLGHVWHLDVAWCGLRELGDGFSMVFPRLGYLNVQGNRLGWDVVQNQLSGRTFLHDNIQTKNTILYHLNEILFILIGKPLIYYIYASYQTILNYWKKVRKSIAEWSFICWPIVRGTCIRTCGCWTSGWLVAGNGTRSDATSNNAEQRAYNHRWNGDSC
jgi:hypothetical protein